MSQSSDSSSIPQRHSPQFTPAPLPVPTRRPTHRANPSLTDSDDGSQDSHNGNNPNFMTHYPYQGQDEDPLRALCHALNVAQTAPLTARHLTNPYELTVLNRTSPTLPSHLLAVHDAPLADPNAPVTLIPIDIETFSRKLRADITGGGRARHHPPTRVVLPPISPAVVASVSAVPPLPQLLPATVFVPLVTLPVPHAPSVPLLLLYALGVRTNPSALAAALLPLSVAEEFPSAAAMAQALAAHCERASAGNAAGSAGGWRPPLDEYTVYNQGMWKNVLALGLQDSRVMSVVQTVWNVTAESRKILARQQERAARTRTSVRR
ncbi:hypothetical protein BJV74DRAFT_878636 [Russula compacta]|nr:hypothetical protein BJV74DRAFT_878636 [Russula compacta]